MCECVFLHEGAVIQVYVHACMCVAFLKPEPQRSCSPQDIMALLTQNSVSCLSLSPPSRQLQPQIHQYPPSRDRHTLLNFSWL